MTQNQELDSMLDGCLKNDRKSQQVLYEKFSPKMLALCTRYAHSKEEAEDMMIEGFVLVFKQLHTFRKECSLETWIRTIMVRTAINMYRSQKKFRLHDDFDEHGEVAEMASNADDIVTKLQAQQVLAVMLQMPDELRVILNLHLIDGLSLKDIAHQLEKKESTVRVYFMRARQWLMKRIQDSEN